MNYTELLSNYENDKIYIMKLENQTNLFIQINKIEQNGTLYGNIYYNGHKYSTEGKMYHDNSIEIDLTTIGTEYLNSISYVLFDKSELLITEFEEQYFENMQIEIDMHQIKYYKYTKMIIIDEKYFGNINDIEIGSTFQNDFTCKEKIFLDSVFTSEFTIRKHVYTYDDYCKLNVSNDAFDIFTIYLYINYL